MKRSIASITLLALFSAIYAAYFAMLPVDAFVDRDNYLAYINFSGDIFGLNFRNSISQLLANEPLWLILNYIIGYFFSAEDGVRLIIFISVISSVFFAGKEIILINGKRKASFAFLLVIIFILLSPLVVKNYIIHLRQGLAIAIFFIISGSRGAISMSLLAALFAAQVHSSFYFVVLLLFSLYAFEWLRFSSTQAVFLACLMVAMIVPFIPVIANFFDARQSIESPDLGGASGFAFMYWVCILAIMLLASFNDKNILKEWSVRLSFCAIFLYLTLYFLSGFSARIFESCLLLVLISFLHLPRRELRYISAMLMALLVYLWAPLLSGKPIFRLAS